MLAELAYTYLSRFLLPDICMATSSQALPNCFLDISSGSALGAGLCFVLQNNIQSTVTYRLRVKASRRVEDGSEGSR